jgi:hypothetical protein
MKKITLGLLISLFGILIAITSYGASELSVSDACRMATATLTNEIIEYNQQYNRQRNTKFKYIIQNSNCVNFESKPYQGTAQVDVLFTGFTEENNRNTNLKRKFFFIRTDQGWIINLSIWYNINGTIWNRKEYGR